ncbi:3'5'-cyclic nucleotide phosphodiesterase [Haematococcus lacustris]|uniref:3'5'-cyclic nucleotide phosphodiesterase n=1 Tax=Haematococcus lacustris TaxID=44745 RepID=A0A6A0AFP3_HAELA|nr:3'5'-cyclic nucleotide phosphodiesterase [Haematococcus lacustris]
MENHHLAACFSLLQQPHLNFLSHFAKDVKDKLRKMVIELVLATDMKNHMAITSQFSTVHSLMAKPAAVQHASPAASKQHHELVLRISQDDHASQGQEVAFYDFVGTPMFQNFTRVFPGMQPMMDQLQANYRYWKDKFPPPPPALPAPAPPPSIADANNTST